MPKINLFGDVPKRKFKHSSKIRRCLFDRKKEQLPFQRQSMNLLKCQYLDKMPLAYLIEKAIKVFLRVTSDVLIEYDRQGFNCDIKQSEAIFTNFIA